MKCFHLSAVPTLLLSLYIGAPAATASDKLFIIPATRVQLARDGGNDPLEVHGGMVLDKGWEYILKCVLAADGLVVQGKRFAHSFNRYGSGDDLRLGVRENGEIFDDKLMKRLMRDRKRDGFGRATDRKAVAVLRLADGIFRSRGRTRYWSCGTETIKFDLGDHPTAAQTLYPRSKEETGQTCDVLLDGSSKTSRSGRMFSKLSGILGKTRPLDLDNTAVVSVHEGCKMTVKFWFWGARWSHGADPGTELKMRRTEQSDSVGVTIQSEEVMKEALDPPGVLKGGWYAAVVLSGRGLRNKRRVTFKKNYRVRLPLGENTTVRQIRVGMGLMVMTASDKDRPCFGFPDIVDDKLCGLFKKRGRSIYINGDKHYLPRGVFKMTFTVNYAMRRPQVVWLHKDNEGVALVCENRPQEDVQSNKLRLRVLTVNGEIKCMILWEDKLREFHEVAEVEVVDEAMTIEYGAAAVMVGGRPRPLQLAAGKTYVPVVDVSLD